MEQTTMNGNGHADLDGFWTCVHCNERQTPHARKVTNAAGTFCVSCTREWTKRGAASRKAKRGICVWCGEKWEAPVGVYPSTGPDGRAWNTCPTCSKGRSWLLTAIRYSDRVARYVTKREEREAPLRLERRRQQEAEAKKPEPAPAPAAPAEERLERLEAKLERLLKALGE